MKFINNRLARKLPSILLAGVLSLSAQSHAWADDQYLDEGLDFTEVEYGTGWYLRGNVGFTREAPSTELIVGNTSTPAGSDLGNSVSFGVAGGYTFGNGIRTEMEVSQFSGFTYSDTSGNFGCGTYQDPNDNTITIIDGGTCRTDTSANLSITNLNINVLMDGPTFSRITPYAGVGVGASMISWDDFKSERVCFGANGIDCTGNGAGSHLLGTAEAAETTDLSMTYSLMLGAAYQVDKNLKLDFGYRYSTTAGSTITQAADNTFQSQDTQTADIDIHEFRVGLRYDIW